MTLEQIIGIGIISFLIIYTSFQIREKHQTLALFLLLASLSFLLFIPILMNQGTTNCEYLLNSTITANNTTTYTYTYQCDTIQQPQILDKFVKTYVGFYLIVATLLLFSLIVWAKDTLINSLR